MRRPAIPIILAAAALTGCGTSGDRLEAAAVVQRFSDAVRHHDGEAACALLSAATVTALESDSGQSCRSVITRLHHAGGAVTHAEVYITSARVELRGGETMFLDRGPQGWRISAVGCRAQDGPPLDVPMQCEAQA
jgi:hypothetical protein